MNESVKSFATMTAGGLTGLALAFALLLGIAPAEVGPTPPVISNAALKQDRAQSDPAAPVRVLRRALAEPVLVSEIQHVGGDVRLVDGAGRIVYRSDAQAHESVVVRDAVLPVRAGWEKPAGLRLARGPEAAEAGVLGAPRAPGPR